MNIIYQISPQIVHENMDGEAIIINMETGVYFSLNASGSEVWKLIEKKISGENIINIIAEVYKQEVSMVQPGLEKFFSQLEQHGLVKTTEEKTESDTVNVREFLNTNDAQFVSPILEIYDDLQDLLLLDPIHEVSETTGWPHQKKEVEGA